MISDFDQETEEETQLLDAAAEIAAQPDDQTDAAWAWLEQMESQLGIDRMTEARDGDGDGLIDDGKPTERVAPNGTAGVEKSFKRKGVFGRSGELVRKKGVTLTQAQDDINQRAIAFIEHLKGQGQNVGGGSIAASNVGAKNQRHEAEIAKATEFLNSVVGPNIKADVNWQMEVGRREQYDPKTGTIKMVGVDPIHSAFIHEMGHHIEKKNPHVAKQVKAFLAKRTKQFGSKPVKMSSFGPGWDKSEVGNDAGFAKAMGSPARGAYAGTVYKDGATEVLSMGLQRLHANPVKFFEDDPDYASFVVGVLNS